MYTLHIHVDEQAGRELLEKANQLAKLGRDVEVLDNKTLAYEKRLIERALQEVERGETDDSNTVWNELLR